MTTEDHINTSYTYRLEGADGMLNMQDVMKMLRFGFKSIGGIKAETVSNHSMRTYGIPKDDADDAVEYRLADGSSVVIISSGTEPVIDVLISVASGEHRNAKTERAAACSAAEKEKRIREDLESIIYIDYRAGYCCE